MNDHSPENPGHEHRHTAQGVSRRRLLAAGGVLVAGGLAGCSAVDGVVDRAASEAIGTKAASPGGLYTGDVQISTSPLYESSAIDVRNVPPTVTAAGQRIELEGWATTSRLDAQNHNASRSNRTSPVQSDDPDHIGAYNFTIEIEGAWAGDTDGDGPTDAVVLAEILDMTEACWVYAEACRAAATEEDAGAVERYAGGFGDVCRQLRRALERCSDDRCRALAESNERRLSSVPRAVQAAEAGEWDRCVSVCRELAASCDSDADGLGDDLDSDDDGLLDATEELYGYLDGDATIGEDFVVSVPDSAVRDGGPSVDAELTPQRVMEYFLGEKDADGCSTSDRAVEIHRDLACRNVLSARLEERRKKTRGVAGFVNEDGSVVVTGGAVGAGAEQMLKLDDTEDGVRLTNDPPMDRWGQEIRIGAAGVSPTLVCPVAATPDGCPCPMPGLFYVCRVRHEDQLLFVGGWRLDEGGLYRDAATLLVYEGVREVGLVSPEAARSDFQDGDDLVLRKRPGRTKYGNITLSVGDYDADNDTDSIPEGMRASCGAGEPYCWDVQSHAARARKAVGAPCPENGNRCLISALDSPVLHLGGATELSNDVKFKAGAELSKAVN